VNFESLSPTNKKLFENTHEKEGDDHFMASRISFYSSPGYEFLISTKLNS